MISYIISHLVSCHVLVNRRHQNTGAEHKLILHGTAVCILIIRIFQEHRSHHRKACILISGFQIGCGHRAGINIRHQHGFHLHIHPVDSGIRITESKRCFHIASPSVHVEHLRCKGFPLVISCRNQRFPAENSVHITSDIRVSA